MTTPIADMTQAALLFEAAGRYSVECPECGGKGRIWKTLARRTALEAADVRL